MRAGSSAVACPGSAGATGRATADRISSAICSSDSLLSVVFMVVTYDDSPCTVPARSVAMMATTSANPSNSLCRNRQGRATTRPPCPGQAPLAGESVRGRGRAGLYQTPFYKWRATFSGRVVKRWRRWVGVDTRAACGLALKLQRVGPGAIEHEDLAVTDAAGAGGLYDPVRDQFRPVVRNPD